MPYGTPHAPCQICQRPMQPYDPMTFQEGALLHARCREQRTRQGIAAEDKAATLHAWRPAESS
jgi:hypothetical protein